MRIVRRQAVLRRRAVAAVIGLCLAGCNCLLAADAELGEYQVKAAYLYNFITFTEWPAATGEGLQVCVYGPDPFGADLDALQGKVVGGRALAVARATTVELLDDCHVVFLTREVIGNLPRVLDRIRGRPVLTIADSVGAARQGVGINMRNDTDRIVFDVNLEAVHAQDLNLSFRLLRLAEEVINE